MVHHESLRFTVPLRDVHLAGGELAGSARPTAAEVDTLTRAAYERGRLEGEQAVSEQLVRQRVEFSELQGGLLAELRGTIPRVAQECEATMITLALEAAQRLVAGLPISAKLVEAVVREAIAQANDASEIEVRLNDDDLKLLKRAKSPLLAAGEGPQKLVVVAAPEISRGGCLVHTRFGTVDAQRETKLENLRQSLAE
ncbi:MAG: hypothetical protein HZA92_00015 [Verrucomicrobia bacterium]|nr:hypothetical protein [Verrucomicrobiota bacterium]